MPALLLVMWITFSLINPQYLSPRNLSNLMIELSATATLSVGMLLVLLPGHTDLSAGSGAALAGGTAAVLITQSGLPAAVAIPASIGVCVAAYTLLGRFIVNNRIQAFIVTLAALLIFRGIHREIINDHTIPVTRGGEANLYSLLTTWYLPATVAGVLAAVLLGGGLLLELKRRARMAAAGAAPEAKEDLFLRWLVMAQAVALAIILCGQHNGVPLCFLILCAVAAGVHILTKHTAFGRHLYAIGGNEEAAVISGIRVQRTVIIAFALLGGIVAIAGLMQTAYGGHSTPDLGELMELNAIAACVIGGASLKGGRGAVLGALFGALLMASLNNGLTLLSVEDRRKLIANGLVLGFAVWVDARFSRR